MRHFTNISKSYLFRLSIPIVFSNIAIPFVGLVDTGLMGHLSSEKFLAAISVATSVITMIFWSYWCAIAHLRHWIQSQSAYWAPGPLSVSAG